MVNGLEEWEFAYYKVLVEFLESKRGEIYEVRYRNNSRIETKTGMVIRVGSNGRVDDGKLILKISEKEVVRIPIKIILSHGKVKN